MSSLLLTNAKIFDGEQILENGELLIQNDQIAQIGELAKGSAPGSSLDISSNDLSEAKINDLQGKTVLPGLIDCHIHLDLHGMADTYNENFAEDKVRSIRAAKEMEATLLSGFTTIRNVGSVNWIDISVKEAAESGLFNGPRILTSGKILSITCSGTEYFDGLYQEANGPDEFKKAARDQLKLGADLIKIMATGAVMNPGGVPGAAQPDVDEMAAAVKEANKLNKKVAAHAHGSEGIKNSVIAGVDTIEHGTFADDEAIKLMADHGTFLVPTLAPDYYMAKKGEEGGIAPFMVEKLRNKRTAREEALQKAIDQGVKVANGSDAGTPYNYQGGNAREIVELVERGFMSPQMALTSATKTAAEACGLEEVTGTLQAGKQADLIVLNNCPLEDIQALLAKENISAVMKDGNWAKNQLK